MTHSVVRCLKRIPQPHQSRKRFWVAATVLTLVFILACPFTVHNRFAVPFDLQSRPLSGFRYSKFKGRQIPWLLCRQDPVGLFLFHGLEKTANNVFLARFPLRHELYPVVSLASPSRHRCVPLYSSVVEPNFVLPPLNVVGVPTRTPRCPASPSSGSSPTQNGAKSQHNWDITIKNGPRHGNPDFTRDFLGQQRETHLPRL